MNNAVVGLIFESVGEILWCDHSNKSYSAVPSNGAICFSAFYKMEVANFVEFFFSICGSGRVKGT